MKIGILTSSRADYGIYLPLLRALNKDDFFETELLVFGTHMSRKFGYTVKQIESDKFSIAYRIHTTVKNDRPRDILKSMIRTQSRFSEIWQRKSYDLVIALGDRYEMFAAVSSSVPFNIPIAHIHGGETTLGAIDNIFRHSITCMSKLHFTCSEIYRTRVVEITGTQEGVYNVGALSIDNLMETELLTVEEFNKIYGIDLARPTILFTFHPETILPASNIRNVEIIDQVLGELTGRYQVVITMPNSDAFNDIYRKKLISIASRNKRIFKVESLGSRGYLSCMKHCSMMIGNTSSGFVEASWFPKPVINIGNRQKGRILTSNIISCPVEKDAIINAVHFIEKNRLTSVEHIYGDGTAAKKIILHIKEFAKRNERI